MNTKINFYTSTKADYAVKCVFGFTYFQTNYYGTPSDYNDKSIECTMKKMHRITKIKQGR